MAAPKPGRRPLGVLINEITACLDSTGEAASIQQASDSTVLAARMRAVLPMVFAHVDHQNGVRWADCMRQIPPQ